MPKATVQSRALPVSIFPTQEYLDYIWTEWLKPGHIKPDALDQRLAMVHKDLVMGHKELVELPFSQFKDAFLRVVRDRGLADRVSGPRKRGPKPPSGHMRAHKPERTYH